MLIVAINTAVGESAIALISASGGSNSNDSNPKVLGEESWISNANESEKILPGIQCLLIDADKKWKDVSGIFVIQGPGSFTRLRVGIAIANALAWGLDIPLYSAEASILKVPSGNSFGEQIAILNFEKYQTTTPVEPIYLYPPRITARKSHSFGPIA